MYSIWHGKKQLFRKLTSKRWWTYMPHHAIIFHLLASLFRRRMAAWRVLFTGIWSWRATRRRECIFASFSSRFMAGKTIFRPMNISLICGRNLQWEMRQRRHGRFHLKTFTPYAVYEWQAPTKATTLVLFRRAGHIRLHTACISIIEWTMPHTPYSSPLASWLVDGMPNHLFFPILSIKIAQGG